MKKIYVLALCLSTLFSFAQLELKKLDGTVINDGDVFQFNQLTDPGNYLGLKVYNLSQENEMMYKARVISMTNTNGQNLQLCIGTVCLPSISVGSTYPNFPPTLDPLAENGDFDHFMNQNPGIDPNLPVEYVIKIYQVNNGGAEVGNSVTFTYRYDSNLSTGNFTLDQLGIRLQSNIVTDLVTVSTQKNVGVNVYDLNGKMVSSVKLSAGEKTVDVSGLSAGMYILNFSTEQGQKSAVKIVKR